jgi:NADH-quinone oxidoreductase subunit L
VHESPRSMTLPLAVLAFGSVVVGFLGIPHAIDKFHIGNKFEHFTAPAFEIANRTLPQVFTHVSHDTSLEIRLMVLSVLIAAAGILLATFFYKMRPAIPERLATTLAGPHRLLLNKYYVDELYDRVFVRGLALGGGNGLWGVDRHLIDGGDGKVRPAWPLSVNGIAWMTRDLVGKLSSWWDRWIVDGVLVRFTAFALDNLSYLVRTVQNGLVQHYALTMMACVFLIIAATRWILGLY